jgi:hypothetical protein
MTRLLRITIMLVAVGCLTTACTEREADMAPMDDATAEQIVERYAREALEFSGWSGFSEHSVAPGPCVGRQGEDSDTIYSMQGAYQLLVPGTDQLPLIDRVREGWQARGYTITAQRTLSAEQGDVRATNPDDGASLVLTSGEIPAMLLLIHTGCYQRTQ